MRLQVINPNSTASMTEKIGIAARAVAAQDTVIEALDPGSGPVSIEGYYDEALSLPGLLRVIAEGEKRGVDGHVIACFDDTGLEAARCLAKAPVLGICEAGCHFASPLGSSFAVITTLGRSVPALRHNIAKYGFGQRCAAVLAAEVPVLALEDPHSQARGLIEEQLDLATRQYGAEAVLLGCAGMTDLAADLSRRVGLPVIDGVAAAVKMLEGLVTLGLQTSKVGGFATPLAKEYQGDLAAFAPQSLMKENGDE